MFQAVPPRLPTPYRPESEIVAQRLQQLDGTLYWAHAARTAEPWVQAVRENPPPFWAMESLLKEYPISSAEGLALMRLAEALLRVPDAETAIALTTDQLGRADFEASGDKVLARLSSTAIALSKHFLPDAQNEPGLMAKLGARTVVAATLRAVQLLGRQFVLGQTMPEAMKEADAARKKANVRFSYDMLGEGARTDKDALRYLKSYGDAIDFIAARASKTGALAENDGISIKLSALYPRYEDAHRQAVLDALVPRVWTLCEAAAAAHINLTIDAEEVDRLELSLEVLEALLVLVARHCPQWTGLGLAMQAYQTRALELIEHVTVLARKYQIKLMCRLVKGAYWDAEIKRAQELGLPHYPVFTHKHHTDVSYLACARALLAAPDAIYPQFATHNAATIAAILQMGAKSGAPFELQRLHGMGEGVYREVLKNPLVACRVYAPVGAHKDLLAYLVRRLLENGANSSFVHQLADESVGMEELLISPLRLEPHPSLPLPADLFGTHPGSRANSTGLDLTVATMRDPLLAALPATPVPVVPEFDTKRVPDAYAACASSYQKWSKVPVEERAVVLRRAADALQAAMPQFCALLVKEAFKTWGDAVSEVREAVDFLRYYADEAQRIMQPIQCPVVANAQAGYQYGVTGETNTLRLTARGVWVCISPWNFPLAIFMGQVAAALATGNTVLAKPAEQTPGVAKAAVDLMVAAGVPADALQLLHGAGETVGAALVAQPGVAGVVFTGSTQVAKIIQRALAAKDGPIVPLIAETGGINAMLVDSSALPEQVVDAVVQSAFRSAGQRCSALRLLVVHQAIADGVIEMLQGAAQELQVGTPADLATDLGPLIDREAYDNIQRHIDRLKNESKVLVAPVNSAQTATNLIANLIAPHAFEVASIAQVKAEIFGPVLQVVRWGTGDTSNPEDVIAHINALGYGLTLGIQTRIDSRAQALANAAHVGNIYINRNMIGAVVGVQPFGGEGLSGTGPKAGGPHYLFRFCAEQTVTVNTTAAGGNAALLASLH
ncbi:MAG: bifunctional proline dehydrogenase/L-glutamate gamma-semialdehyde dehydrogenase [Curvibacter sp. RIFCSPHIGHO2_12_FULL_63_18]|uniref:L-glutamate gamma-semialdehyde dehydrogenase n=1 Tax=Rhodoferax sp. TaxID=50421 RepID=UPI0008C5443A|nr:L-glutamate gamma-semialdehyde dehydrogenase [Rhodoferax sp.]OGO97465.1 MAG: bifunctional proline dehydrogenase/L-glutamate gamma-semialdehyde dehydrogenase [Curvibacter sp. GWA2_63_95]OGO98790.1 MAG: bifunctional proline dehydrogenase/L-glutamate gamma-semialdehyde dehydrogenase [Curvibacter sp. RIFCSPHIGHO2_12_FULL_63_18]HCX81458.1 delta-1-pyrroline-5-carboxylate dehydrogenase [Rhodoferax sp.]